jgi:hypothetical protein
MAYTVDRKAIKVRGQRDERLDPSHHVADECQLRQSSMRSVNSSQVIFHAGISVGTVSAMSASPTGPEPLSGRSR